MLDLAVLKMTPVPITMGGSQPEPHLLCRFRLMLVRVSAAPEVPNAAHSPWPVITKKTRRDTKERISSSTSEARVKKMESASEPGKGRSHLEKLLILQPQKLIGRKEVRP